MGKVVMEKFTYLLLVLFLDFLFKDPEYLWHPVRLQGRFLAWWEARVQKRSALRLWGGLGTWGVVFFSGSIVYLLGKTGLGWFFDLYFGYAVLAFGSLFTEGLKIYNLLTKDELLARKKLGFLVSRDTEKMQPEDMHKALIETLAENFNDGVVAPFFYLALGGPVLAWMYKAVSTVDSMWGYKQGYYQKLGFWGAKLDDILAYLPARISALLFYLAGFTLLKKRIVFKNFYQDAHKSESPNAGWPMAMAAHLLGVELGGKAIYFGQEKVKPVLGVAGAKPDKSKVQECLLLLVLSYVWLIFLTFLICLAGDKLF